MRDLLFSAIKHRLRRNLFLFCETGAEEAKASGPGVPIAIPDVDDNGVQHRPLLSPKI